jgi:hypothetical protein
MFDRENAVGFLLLAVCAVVGGVMVVSMATGTELRYTGPAWLAWLLAALFLGASLFGLSRGRHWGNPRWPDPRTGRRRWWRFRGRDDDRQP